MHQCPFSCSLPRYTEKASNVEQEETVLNIRFVKLDCSALKSSLVQHCSDWQTKLTQLLSHMASNRLKELHASLRDNVNRWGVKCCGAFFYVFITDNKNRDSELTELSGRTQYKTFCIKQFRPAD